MAIDKTAQKKKRKQASRARQSLLTSRATRRAPRKMERACLKKMLELTIVNPEDHPRTTLQERMETHLRTYRKKHVNVL